MQEGKIFVDSNVLIYSFSKDRNKKEIAKNIIKKGYFISIQVLNEISNTLIRKNKLPIPNFWPMKFDSESITRLPEKFKIYIFEAKQKILNRDLMTHKDYMPDKWKHGYSKGVAINDETYEIIYWFVLW